MIFILMIPGKDEGVEYPTLAQATNAARNHYLKAINAEPNSDFSFTWDTSNLKLIRSTVGHYQVARIDD